jgi:hypothetical protein
VRAYKGTDQDALRAYHLDRVVSKFKAVISAENAELLAELLGNEDDEKGSVAENKRKTPRTIGRPGVFRVCVYPMG